ncbi:hypothetical protein Fmac_002271 [Flemingia macrophylla]|uniref:Uncharacterized protein n=1 Tax=Flemingia macrophylla TaxID=520843 RepID=A0ABD1NK24_9FABA
MEKDLALRANLDGTELLIYPSSILPKNSQHGDDVKIVDKIPTFDLNAYPEDADDMKIVEKIPGLDLNAYPQDEDCMEIVYENPETGGKGGSRDRVLVVGSGSVKVEHANVEVPSTSLPIAPNSTILDQNDWKDGAGNGGSQFVPTTRTELAR